MMSLVPRPPASPELRPLSEHAAVRFAAALRHSLEGRLPEAEAIYRQLLSEDPQAFDVMTLLATVLIQQGQPDEAIGLLRASLALSAHQPMALNSLGVALCQLGQRDQAVEAFRAARDHRFADAWHNLASTLVLLGRFTEALAVFDSSPGPPDATRLEQRVPCLLSQGRVAEAMESLDQVLTLEPEHADALFRKAEISLFMGDYAEGWRLYEWRWRIEGVCRPVFDAPVWDGRSSLLGRTILIYAEQGLGDTIQFVRFLPALAARAGRVVFLQPPEFGGLLRGVEVVSEPVACDVWYPLMSLPLALSLRPADLPFATSYIQADPVRAARWVQRLGARRRPRVGLVWAGGLRGTMMDLRFMRFDDVRPLLDCEAEFFSLQVGGGVLDDRVTDLGPALVDLAETAAVIAALDLVITVDTAVAHLAGAMGVPVWVMLWNLPDWRWGDGDGTPWYPSARLFRQRGEVGLDGVVAEVRKELEAWR